MAFGSKAKEDRVTHSLRRTRVILEACAHVAGESDVLFLDLDLDGKRTWLAANMAAVIERAVAVGGPDFEKLREFNIFVVENAGHAVLYFERK